jgi:hypothetical protein
MLTKWPSRWLPIGSIGFLVRVMRRRATKMQTWPHTTAPLSIQFAERMRIVQKQKQRQCRSTAIRSVEPFHHREYNRKGVPWFT